MSLIHSDEVTRIRMPQGARAPVAVPIIEPPPPTGDILEWTNSAQIVIQQSGTYPLAADLSNPTGDAAKFAYSGRYAGLSSRGLSLDRLTGVITAASNATVGVMGAIDDFEAVTNDYPNLSDQAFNANQSDEGDGCTYYHANHFFYFNWVHPGGDWLDASIPAAEQGTNNYGTIVLPDGAQQVRTYQFSAGLIALINKCRTYRNSGFHLRRISGGSPASFAARWNNVGFAPPLLRVTTEVTTYICPCLVSSWLGEGPGNPEDNPAANWEYNFFALNGILKFDLSQIVGTISEASMDLHTWSGGTTPQTIAINYVNPPPFITRPAIQTGGAVEGIASSVANDRDLASHPSVLFYHEPTNNAEIFAKYLVSTLDEICPLGGHSYVTWPEYAMGAIHGVLPPGYLRMFAWRGHKSPLIDHAPIRTVFFRYMMKLDPALHTNSQQHIKTSGVENPWNAPWAADDAAVFLNPEGGGFSSIHEFMNKSEANPGFHNFYSYIYDKNHLGRTQTLTNARMVPTRSFMKTDDHIYCIETQHTTNTVTPSVLQDGVYRVWLDGVLLHESFNMYIRSGQEQHMTFAPFVHFYHGGGLPALGPIWGEIGGICMATEYIGPPKRVD